MSDLPRAIRIAAAALLAGAGCARAPAVRPNPGAAPVRLAYAGSPGESRRWELVQAWRGRIALDGMPQLVVLKFRGTLEERVLGVTPDGRRRIRVATTLAPPEFNGLPFSLDGQPTRGAAVFTRSADGTLEAAGEGAEDGDPGDLLGWAARALAGAMPPLPPDPVRPGDRWTRLTWVPDETGGGFTLTATGTFTGPAAGGAADLAVGETLSLSRTGAGAAGAPALTLSADAAVRFDARAGAVLAVDQRGTLTLRGGTGGTAIEGRFAITSSLTPSSTGASAP